MSERCESNIHTHERIQRCSQQKGHEGKCTLVNDRQVRLEKLEADNAALRKQLEQEEGENVSLSRVVGERGKEIQALKGQIASARADTYNRVAKHFDGICGFGMPQEWLDWLREMAAAELEKAEKCRS